MRLLIIITILVSSLLSTEYSTGFKLYKNAKKELRNNNMDKANQLFLEAKIIFEEESKKNSSNAFLKLSELYCHGWGVVKDETKAKVYLIKAKRLGVSFISDKCLKNLK